MTYQELIAIRHKRERRTRFYKLAFGFLAFWVVAIANGILNTKEEIGLVVTFYVWVIWMLSGKDD